MVEDDDAIVDRVLPMVRRAEGSGDTAVSPKGAVGRYQIMPSTARALGYDPARLTEPDYNEQAARGAIKDLIKQHGQDDKAILAGYNASPTAVKKWKQNGRNDAVLPAETQNYFKRAGLVEQPQTIAYQPVQGPAGKQAYQKLIDGGFSKAEADQWAQGQADKLRAGGFSEKEISSYFDDKPYDTSSQMALAKKQVAAVPPEMHEKVAQDWTQSLTAGYQSSVLGLGVRGTTPDMVNPEKAGFAQNVAFQAGQMAGDLPAVVAGMAVASETGPVGAFAAGAAVPEAIRGALLDSYRNPNGHKTWNDWAQSYGHIAYDTFKAALVGAVGGKAGSAAAGAVEKIGGKELAQTAAFATAQYPASVASSAALEGRVPDAQDFVAGAALTVGLGLSGHMVGAARRFVPSRTAENVQMNVEDIYKRTGIHPADAAEIAKNDISAKAEVVSRNADGTQDTPTFDDQKPYEPDVISSEARAFNRAMDKRDEAETNRMETDAHQAAEKRMAERRAAGLPPGDTSDWKNASFVENVKARVKPEPDPATAPISDDRALTIRLKQVDEPEFQMPPSGPRTADLAHMSEAELTELAKTVPADKDVTSDEQVSHEQVQEVLREHQKYEDYPDDKLVDVVRQEVMGHPNEPDWFSRVVKGENMDARSDLSASFVRFRGAMEALKKRGFDLSRLPGKLLSNLKDQGWSRSDAAEVLSGNLEFFKRAGAGQGGKPPGEPPIIDGEFREVPPQKQIGEKMPIEDANAIVDSFIGEKPAKPRPWWNPITMYRQYVTELAQSRVLDKELSTDPKTAGVEDMLRQTYGSAGRAGYFTRYGTVKLGRDAKTGDVTYQETPGKSMFAAFEKARELGGTEDGLVRYWVSARALSLEARGITSGLNSAAARRVIEDTSSIYHPALKMLQENNHAVIDYARDSGVFSAIRAQAMKALNPFHVVFQRVVDPTYNPVGKGFGAKQPVSKIEGSTRKIVPPIPAQVDNMHRIIAMADRNLAVGQVLSAYAKLYAAKPELGKAIEFKDRLDPKTLIEDYNKMPLEDRVDEDGHPISAKDAEAFVPLLAQKAFFASRGPNDFLYFNKGIPEIYTARDPETAILLRASQPQGEAHAALKIMEGFANVSRLGIVSLPDFPLRTGIRSQFEAAIRSEHMGLPGHAWLQGIWHVFGQTYKFQQFMKDGGFGASVVDIDEKYVQRDVNALFEKTGTWDRVWNVARHPLEALHKYRAMIENAGRLGYWANAQKAGLSGGKAAMSSRKAFGDNSEKAGLQVMNSWAKITIFMRPSVLDVAYFAQAMRDRPARVMAMGASLITVPTIANFIANKMYDEDKEHDPTYRATHPEYVPYSELPRWQKDMMLVLPPVGGVRMRLPTIPYTGGFVFHTLAERFLSYAMDKDPRAFSGWGQTFMSQFVPPVIPAIALPVYEMATNTRQGTGAPLIPASVEQASPEMQYTKNTSETAKAVSQVLGQVGADISPITLDNYVREWTGPIPSQVVRALDGTMAKDNRPWTLGDMPMVGAFLARHPDMGAQPIEDFYTQMRHFEEKHKDIALAIRNQDFSQLPRLLQDPAGVMKMTQLTKVSQAISAQATVLRNMDTSKMTNAEKQKYMDAGYTQIILQAEAALQVLDSVPTAFK